MSKTEREKVLDKEHKKIQRSLDKLLAYGFTIDMFAEVLGIFDYENKEYHEWPVRTYEPKFRRGLDNRQVKRQTKK